MIEPSVTLGIVEVLSIAALCMAGLHIFAVIGVVGMGFTLLYYGFGVGLYSGAVSIWGESWNYNLSMIPLFILMGTMVAESGLGRDAYDAFARWVGGLKGSLAIVTTMACALFGACTGSSAAAIVAIGGIGIPEMKRFGYSKALRTGVVASASILANLIPPSITAIIYSIFTDVSVGKLFIAGIVPGIILMILYSATAYIWATLKPESAPPITASFTWKEKFSALRLPIPIGLIFMALIGGIYLGWFSPTEGGGIGCVAVLIVTLAFGRLKWHGFNNALMTTVRFTGMMMFLIGSAFMVLHTIAMSRFGDAIGGLMTGMGLGPVGVVWFIAIFFTILGCGLQGFVIIIIFIPMFFRFVTDLGWDPVWFGTFTVVLAELALLTPPVAGNIYITALIDPDCNTTDVIKGVIPFYAAAFILLALLIYFPQLALWLPNMMTGG